ncbi:hypothetical protein D3C87_1819210 [compost metagenome]
MQQVPCTVDNTHATGAEQPLEAVTPHQYVWQLYGASLRRQNITGRGHGFGEGKIGQVGDFFFADR